MSKFGCQAHYTLTLDAVSEPELSKSVSVGVWQTQALPSLALIFKDGQQHFPDGRGVILGGPFNF